MTLSINPYDCYLVMASSFYKGVCQEMLDAMQAHTNNAFKHVLLHESTEVTPELEAVKRQTERKIVLAPHYGAAAHFIVRYLCDDSDLPPAERRVQWIHTISVGFEAIQFQEIPQVLQGLLVTNGKEVSSRPIAEHCIYSMLYFSRKAWQHQKNLREHRWEPYNISELYGKRVLIFGYGDIGRAVAKRALALDMEVTGVRRSRPPQAQRDVLGARVLGAADSLDDAIAAADFIVNCMPATAENENVFDAKRFALMKTSAVYINVGRGTTNNEADLAAALSSGNIRGAALDVFKEEPLPADHPLWSIGEERLLLTPHSSSHVASKRTVVALQFAQLFDMLARGESIERFSINKEMLY